MTFLISDSEFLMGFVNWVTEYIDSYLKNVLLIVMFTLLLEMKYYYVDFYCSFG